jgi:hypothetical protein
MLKVLLVKVMFSLKVSKQPGVFHLVANFIVKNTLSRLYAHWNAGDIMGMSFVALSNT